LVQFHQRTLTLADLTWRYNELQVILQHPD
jgi:hypothetical protein